MKQDYKKIRKALRQWLLGRDYFTAHAALELGSKHHTGVRKDGVTPEFQHQVSQATFCRTLDKNLIFPQPTIAAVLLHDIVEDCAITLPEVIEFLDASGATDRELELIERAVEGMTNQFGVGFVNGEKSPKKPKDTYYGEMVECPITSICKGLDRMHNHQSMVGVFSTEKQLDYIGETRDFIIPMLKEARKKWVRQEAAYTNIKHVLQVQMEFVEAMALQESRSIASGVFV